MRRITLLGLRLIRVAAPRTESARNRAPGTWRVHPGSHLKHTGRAEVGDLRRKGGDFGAPRRDLRVAGNMRRQEHADFEMKAPPLQPLRIPGNWLVSYNTFHELDPSDATKMYLCEDLFQATCARTNVLVDLGWYPDGEPTGNYVVQAYLGDFHGRQLHRVEAATRADAVRRLEELLWRYHATVPAD